MTYPAAARRQTGATQDRIRTARLLFDAELTSGRLSEDKLMRPEILDGLAVDEIPRAPRRLLEALADRRARTTNGDQDAGVTGPSSPAPPNSDHAPRFLVRVDEFPHYLARDQPRRFGTQRFAWFTGLMRSAGLPYLVAVLPKVSEQPLAPRVRVSHPLDPDERATIQTMRSDGVALALHGLDHRTRFRSPRRRSEFSGLPPQAVRSRLNAGLEELADLDVRPRVFIPPFNRFQLRQWPVISERFDVVGGGPEAVRLLGRQPIRWLGDAVYVPAYAPFYGTAAQVLPAAERVIAEGQGGWVPVVLHWGWESEAGGDALQRLLEVIAPYTADWQEFLAAVDRSR